ncbi:SixA phosphatase family protein [Halorhodospira neutriphila]|uniref:Phosphohistidine phosphatase, SixA n=1 Tax=Halorhodospira neutriphila TaxID=168379 RepID=A0ABS1E5X9_9GAMM|nr:hypothetical protein [Halorhodospira neutriphila]MBK1725786.1 hypothetical protein [Halorhodospira neutriphila]
MPQVLVVRHAIAEEAADAPGGTDAARRLTGQGQARMREAALGLRHVLARLPVIGYSPLVRAAETAAILDAVYPEASARREVAALAPGGDGEALFDWVRSEAAAGAEAVALVGHEPDLGQWCGLALCGEPHPAVHFKKAGACLLELPEAVAPGRARLLGHFPPRILRALATVAK